MNVNALENKISTQAAHFWKKVGLQPLKMTVGAARGKAIANLPEEFILRFLLVKKKRLV